jgi:butyryl-CoA dehydrogenase
MDYFLTEEQKEIQRLTRQIAEKEIRPMAQHYDRTGEFPWTIVKSMASADLFRVFIDKAYEGMATESPIFNMVLVIEELSRACGGVALSFAGTVLGALPVIIAGSEKQKKRFLPDVAAGRRLASFALSESQAGSDMGAMATKARRDGDCYVLNGTKKWITNGEEAEIYSVFCLTNRDKGPRGSSCIVVEKGTPGFEFGKMEEKMGIRASATRELIFQDCHVPIENRLGPEGTGFVTAIRALNRSRPGIAAQAVGIAQGALDLAIEYACGRRQFGCPVATFQGLRFLLADMAMRLEAARALTYSVARHLDSSPEEKSTMYSAMSKCFASDVAMQITTDAVQVFGAYGYMRDCPIEKFMRDAKITQIYEGTNQILRDEIGKILTGQFYSHKRVRVIE